MLRKPLASRTKGLSEDGSVRDGSELRRCCVRLYKRAVLSYTRAGLSLSARVQRGLERCPRRIVCIGVAGEFNPVISQGWTVGTAGSVGR